MSFSTNMQATALRLLTKYGSAVTVTRSTVSTYNDDGSVVAVVSSFTGVGNSDKYSVLQVDNVNILATDIKFLFYSATEPKVGDVVTYLSVDYRVENVDIDITQGNKILYTLQLRV